jgi:DNA polymerase-3 subunit delta'
MAFKDFPAQEQSIQLLQRSLERGRLAHGYLFTGAHLDELEAVARNLAKTLICQQPVRKGGKAVDCCDHCLSCQKIEHANHADVRWIRPESKSRVITIDQIRDLMQEINLKPTEAEYKVAVIVAADRLNEKAANAFLKTLEEPPARSNLILLTTEPQRILETILSRCLRLNFAGEGPRQLDPARLAWLTSFSELAATEQKSLLGRYRLMDVVLKKLNEMKAAIEEALTARSPLQRYKDVERELEEKWEDELTAAIEAEYRRQRADLLLSLQWWLRDVWLVKLAVESLVRSPESKVKAGEASPVETKELLNFPEMSGPQQVAQRITAKDAMENLGVMEQLQGWLSTNVQEALALEVGLLKLRL